MKYISILLILLLLSGCRKEEPVEISRSAHTLLVYMGGDNNLSTETYEKLKQIKAGWDNSLNGNLLIYQDTPFNDSPRLIKMDNQSASGYITLESYSSENSASPAVLKRVIEDMKLHCPANDYGLILFSHASGWLPAHTLDSPSRSIIIDNNDEMELTDFASAIPDHQFNYIIFEACYMACVEVVYELKEKANYILASSAPIVSPGFTPIYASGIKYLFDQPHGIEKFATSYFDYWDALEGAKRSATISLVKTEGLDDIAQEAKQILTLVSAPDIDLEDLQNFDGTLNQTSYFFDFMDYYNRMGDVKNQIRLQDSFDKCIVYQAKTPSFATSKGVFPISKFSGLTTYIYQDGTETLDAVYKKLKWYQTINAK